MTSAISTADESAMRQAIDASRAAHDAGDMPYGAVLVSAQGEVLHVARNRQVTNADCTAHAEVVLIRESSDRLGAAALRDSTVYASGEPCAMCSGALFWAGVRRIVFAVPSDAMTALFGGDSLPIRCAEVLAGAQPPVQVDAPLLTEVALEVLRQAAARPSR